MTGIIVLLYFSIQIDNFTHQVYHISEDLEYLDQQNQPELSENAYNISRSNISIAFRISTQDEDL